MASLSDVLFNEAMLIELNLAWKSDELWAI